MDKYFIVIGIQFFIYIIIGNYVYANKVLPGLKGIINDNGPSFMPSGQMKHMKLYLVELEKTDTKPWYYMFLKYNTLVSMFIFSQIFLLIILLSLGFK